MLLDVVRIGTGLKIRRERRLSLPGEVLVNEGEELSPQDVVAEVSLPGKFYLLDIADGLDVEVDDAHQFLVRQPGENLMEDDVVAHFEGTIPRLVRTPLPGRFVAYHQGHALLEIERDTIQVHAGMMGVVEAVIPEYGAIITTTGVLVQGVWGNGQIAASELSVLEASWSAPLDGSMIAETDDGRVIAAGQCLDGETLTQLSDGGMVGLIVGSLAPDLIPAALALAVPIIVLQGFGPLPTDPSILDMLKPLDGEMVSVHAAETNRLTGVRPEVIIPQLGEAKDDDLGFRAELGIGHRVRVFSGQDKGRAGKVLAFVDEPPLFESGLQLPAVVVQLNNGERINTPQQNLVILG